MRCYYQPTVVLVLLIATVVLPGCKGSKEGRPQGADLHAIKGRVVAVNPDKKSVKLDHEDIPGLSMKAMVMEFDVQDAKLLEGLKPGDRVQGQLKAEGGTYLITRLEKR